MSSRFLAALLGALGVLAIAAPAAALGARSFEGTCDVAGPIVPDPPVNLVPRLGARASYDGRGTCEGSLDGGPAKSRPVRVRVKDADLLFDTCELGPDLGIPATLRIRDRRRRFAEFQVTLDLVRIVTTGPFVLRGPHEGLAAGVARLVPADQAAAIADCADPNGGLADAQLEASFQTLSPLTGYTARATRRGKRGS